MLVTRKLNDQHRTLLIIKADIKIVNEVHNVYEAHFSALCCVMIKVSRAVKQESEEHKSHTSANFWTHYSIALPRDSSRREI